MGLSSDQTSNFSLLLEKRNLEARMRLLRLRGGLSPSFSHRCRRIPSRKPHSGHRFWSRPFISSAKLGWALLGEMSGTGGRVQNRNTPFGREELLERSRAWRQTIRRDCSLSLEITLIGPSGGFLGDENQFGAVRVRQPDLQSTFH
jgi:hypothetical protein